MLEFLQNNLSTIVIIAAVILCLFLAVRKIIKDKKSGKCSCGENCTECSKNCEYNTKNKE